MLLGLNLSHTDLGLSLITVIFELLRVGSWNERERGLTDVSTIRKKGL